jgi:hypothetical protein
VIAGASSATVPGDRSKLERERAKEPSACSHRASDRGYRETPHELFGRISEFNPDAFARFARHPTTAPSRCPSFVAGLQFWLLSKATAKKYTAGAALGSEVQQDRYHPRSLTLHGCSITFDRRILERPCELRSHFFSRPAPDRWLCRARAAIPLMEMSFPASPSNSLRGIGLMVLDDALTFHLDDRGKIWRSHRPNL